MRATTALWFFLIVGLIYGVGISLFLLNSSDADEIYSTVMFSICWALPCAWFVSSFGSIARHILWRVKGNKSMPVFIYPLFINFRERTELILNFDPFGNCDIVSPSGYKAFEGAEEKLARHDVYEIEKRTLLLELSLCVAIAAASVFYEKTVLLFALIFFVMIFMVVSCIRDNLYHGQISRARAIKAGLLSHYCERSAIINSGDVSSMIAIWLHQIKYPQDYVREAYGFELSDLISLKYLLLMACANKKEIPSPIMNHIESKIIEPFKFGRFFFDPESIEITKLFMYYGLIHEKADKTVIATDKFIELMYDESIPMGSAMLSSFEWYVNIGKYKRISTSDGRGKKMKLLSKDYPYCKFRSYKALVNDLEAQIKNICQFQPIKRN
jgi:hypothetical protein